MAQIALDASKTTDRTAVLVLNLGSELPLCPFFAKCGGILVFNGSDGSKQFHACDRTDAKSICRVILDLKPQRFICGFIPEPEKKRLNAAGIDVRLGSCSCPVDELVASFFNLPKA